MACPARRVPLRLCIPAYLRQLASQAGTIGRLEAELVAEREAKSSLVVSGAPQPVRTTLGSPLARRRVVAPWMLLAVVALGAVVMLLMWPR